MDKKKKVNPTQEYLKQIKTYDVQIENKSEEVLRMNDLAIQITAALKPVVVSGGGGGKDKVGDAGAEIVDPTGEEILDRLRRKIPNPDKGRLLLLPEEWMALRKNAKTDAILGQFLGLLKESYGAKSKEYTDAPVFAEGIPSDTNLDDAIDIACNRLKGFASLYRLTGEKHYAERSASECEALAYALDFAP